MNVLAGKRVVLGVTGSVAAYKAAQLVRELRGQGAEVRVVMTRAAEQFVGPLTFQALSGQPVRTAFIDADAEAAMGHIELARWADRIVVAPASADFLARLAHGRADDLLTAVCLVSEVPILVAPAMNPSMWSNAATRANCEHLQARRIALLGPETGDQACGETGPGRMLEPEALAARIADSFSSAALAGCRVLITAGPTREPLDPVRFLGNRSSGKMGYALARAAREAGAGVVLVSGPTQLAPPPGVERVQVNSAREMLDAVMARVGEADVFVGAAAVADFRPRRPQSAKAGKHTRPFALELEPTEDILAAVAALDGGPFAVGFAAQTENVTEQAREKLVRKGLDMIVANQVGPGLGFETDDNAVDVIWSEGEEHFQRQPKERLARELIRLIAARYHAKNPTKDS